MSCDSRQTGCSRSLTGDQSLHCFGSSHKGCVSTMAAAVAKTLKHVVSRRFQPTTCRGHSENTMFMISFVASFQTWIFEKRRKNPQPTRRGRHTNISPMCPVSLHAMSQHEISARAPNRGGRRVQRTSQRIWILVTTCYTTSLATRMSVSDHLCAQRTVSCLCGASSCTDSVLRGA